MGYNSAMKIEITAERDYSAFNHFYSQDVSVLTNYLKELPKAEAEKIYSRLSTFLSEIGSDATWWLFEAIAKTKAVSVLTDNEILKFAYEMGSDAAVQWFKALAKTGTKDKRWSDYLFMIIKEISKKPSQYIELNPIQDEKILKIAIENWNGKSKHTQLYRYSLASALQKQTNVDYGKIFCGKLEDTEKYCNKVLNRSLKKKGIEHPEKFTLNEKLLLLKSYLYDQEIKQLNTVAELESGGYVIGVLNLGKIDQQTQKKVSLEDAVNYIVLGLNGTKDPNKKELAKNAINWIKKIFPDVAGPAINEWNEIRNRKINELGAAYTEFEKDPTRENAEKVFSIFKGKEHEALDNIAVNIEALTNNYSRGKYLISFQGKSQFMLFDSSELAACAFLPSGAYKSAAFGYLLNSGVILVGFAIVDKIPENPNWNYVDKEVRKMNAVAICGTATIEGRRVLYVDSLESNLRNWEILKTHYKFIIDSLIEVAKRNDLDGVAVYTKPSNQTPKELVKLLRHDNWPESEATIMTGGNPYFEGLGEADTDTVTVLLQL
ncbi:MAG: hypothetical protein QXF85_02535, partial [Candidatus Micrarchaeaceae archaeon]